MTDWTNAQTREIIHNVHFCRVENGVSFRCFANAPRPSIRPLTLLNVTCFRQRRDDSTRKGDSREVFCTLETIMGTCWNAVRRVTQYHGLGWAFPWDTGQRQVDKVRVSRSTRSCALRLDATRRCRAVDLAQGPFTSFAPPRANAARRIALSVSLEASNEFFVLQRWSMTS